MVRVFTKHLHFNLSASLNVPQWYADERIAYNG